MGADLLTDPFFADLEASDGGIESAITLPPACYTDEAFYRFEQEALFNHEWLCVGRESQVAEPGDYFTTRIIGEPIVVVRNPAGDIRAMSAVCQHRAMLVAEGAGNTRGFVCPYHHWVYSLDGRPGECARHGAYLRFPPRGHQAADLPGGDSGRVSSSSTSTRRPRPWRHASPR